MSEGMGDTREDLHALQERIMELEIKASYT